MSAPGDHPLVFVIVGPSGAGKGSIAHALAHRVSGLWLSRSWTTRAPRPGEDADAYRFVDEDTFDVKDRAGGFVESARVFGHRYGTPVPDHPAGMDILLEIDVQGAAQVRRRDPGAVVLLVLPPSREIQRQRLLGRGDDDRSVVARLDEADREEATGRALADHVVVNDDLSRAVDEAAAIVEAHRIERHRLH